MSPETRGTLLTRLHAFSGTIGLLIILTFLGSTIYAELGGDEATIQAVKRAIAWALLALVPALAMAGISGAVLSGQSQALILQKKKRRMAIIAANGILVLVPCALVLHWLARSGNFGVAFYAVQVV